MIRLFNLFLAVIFSLTLSSEASVYLGDHLIKKVLTEDIEIDFSEQENANEDSDLIKVTAFSSYFDGLMEWREFKTLSNPVNKYFPSKSKYSLYLLYCNLKLDC